MTETRVSDTLLREVLTVNRALPTGSRSLTSAKTVAQIAAELVERRALSGAEVTRG